MCARISFARSSQLKMVKASNAMVPPSSNADGLLHLKRAVFFCRAGLAAVANLVAFQVLREHLELFTSSGGPAVCSKLVGRSRRLRREHAPSRSPGLPELARAARAWPFLPPSTLRTGRLALPGHRVAGQRRAHGQECQ